MATRANSTPASRSAIMATAWALYRKHYSNRPFVRLGLQWALKAAWHAVKEAARVAAIPAAAKTARIQEIKAELAHLPYQTLRYNVGARETELRAELRQLAA